MPNGCSHCPWTVTTVTSSAKPSLRCQPAVWQHEHFGALCGAKLEQPHLRSESKTERNSPCWALGESKTSVRNFQREEEQVLSLVWALEIHAMTFWHACKQAWGRHLFNLCSFHRTCGDGSEHWDFCNLSCVSFILKIFKHLFEQLSSTKWMSPHYYSPHIKKL